MKTITLSIVVILLASCISTQNKNASVQNKLQGKFEITQVKSNFNLPAQIHISFDSVQNTMSGNAGCNQFFGGFTQKQERLTFSHTAVTKKLCLDEGVNKIENEVLKLLDQVASYELEEDQLKLNDENGTTLFVAAPFTEVKETKTVAKADFTIIYDVSSMIGQEQIIMTSEKMTCNKISPKASEFSFAVLPMEAKKAETELDKLPLDKIESLESPTQDRHLDGASYAKLIITYQGNTYTTKDFDHGKPPAELEALVQVLLNNTPCP